MRTHSKNMLRRFEEEKVLSWLLKARKENSWTTGFPTAPWLGTGWIPAAGKPARTRGVFLRLHNQGLVERMIHHDVFQYRVKEKP